MTAAKQKERTIEKTEASAVLDDYMMRTPNSNISESKRGEERSDKALQFFMTLLTAILAGNIAVILESQDQTIRLWVIAISLVSLAVFATLTYFWLIVSNTFRVLLRMERFHLYMYFRDRDPQTLDKYGKNVYSFLPHDDITTKKNPFFVGAVDLTIAATLCALVLFSGLAAGIGAFLIWLNLQREYNGWLGISISLVWIVGLSIAWIMANKNVMDSKAASLILIKKYGIKRDRD